MANPLTLHHVGYRFPDLGSYHTECSLFREGIERPATDHSRMYFPVEGHYREHQFFPNGPQDRARHWDFVTPDPRGFLRFIAEAYGQEPTFWEYEENSPVGVVWIADKDGSQLGVMAREDWWKVEGLHDTQRFYRGDKVLLLFPADHEKRLNAKRIKCVVLEGDSGREGQFYSADHYVLQTREADVDRGIREGEVFDNVKLELMIRL
jgi:hypothetical protein